MEESKIKVSKGQKYTYWVLTHMPKFKLFIAHQFSNMFIFQIPCTALFVYLRKYQTCFSLYGHCIRHSLALEHLWTLDFEPQMLNYIFVCLVINMIPVIPFHFLSLVPSLWAKKLFIYLQRTTLIFTCFLYLYLCLFSLHHHYFYLDRFYNLKPYSLPLLFAMTVCAPQNNQGISIN